MKTLFWTGSVCHSVAHGQAALWRWWNYYHQHEEALGITHYAAFNDGSQNLPVEFFVVKQDGALPLADFHPNCLNLVYWDEALGRRSVHDIPGFWRNLVKVLEVCQAQHFDRFILVEYDAVILSPAMLYEIGGTTTGLTCYWCPTYQMPETAIVICGHDRFERTLAQARALRDKAEYGPADRFEVAMDWTDIRRHRVGDRYGETLQPIPGAADYCCQLPPHAYLAWGRVVRKVTG